MNLKQLLLTILVACGAQAMAQQALTPLSVELKKLRSMEADTVTLLVAPKFIAVRTNNGYIDIYTKEKEIQALLKVATSTGKHVVTLNSTPEDISYKSINAKLDAGLKTQNFIQKTDQYLQQEDDRPPSDRQESLYTCVAGFGYDPQYGADHFFNHNYYAFLKGDLMLVINRKGVAEFRHLQLGYGPFHIRPVDENRSTNQRDPRSPPKDPSEGMPDVQTDRSRITSESAAEAEVQTALHDKVANTEEEIAKFKEDLQLSLNDTLNKRGVPISAIEKAYHHDFDPLKKAVEKLSACKSLKNGTIDAAVVKELVVIKEKEKILNDVYRPQIKKINDAAITH